MRLSTVKRRTHIKLFETNVRMSEKLQGFVLLLPAVGGQDAVDVLLDGIVFPHTFFQASVLSVQPILFFGQSGIFLAQLGKVGELITDARRFQRSHSSLIAVLTFQYPLLQISCTGRKYPLCDTRYF